ncbi:MAG: SPFH domain-containing protein [Candidatus Wallbacteria bacterium]
MEGLISSITANAAYVAGFILLVIFLFMYIWATRYIKVGPNEVLIIAGRKRKVLKANGNVEEVGYRIVHGGGAFVIPVIEQAQIMSMELITLEVKTPPVITLHGVPILVDGVAQIKVKSDEVAIGTAAEQFLSKTQAEIMRIAHQTLEGHLRAILGTMTVEDIYKNRDEFAIKVQQVSAPDLSNMGLCIVSFTLRDIKDEHGYLESLGKTRIAEVKKDATIGEANALKEATMKSAVATQDGEIAKIEAKTKIAEANRDFEMKQAEYQASINQRKAETDLAYDLQYNKSQQLVKREEINVQIVEKERAIEVQEKEVMRKQKELEATVIKPADAEKTKIQMISDADRYKIATTASGQAEAQKLLGLSTAEAEKAKGLAEAEVLKIRGMNEAQIIEAKGLAEANAMAEKAASWEKYGNAAIVQMVIEKLPELAKAISEPLSKTEKIVMINSGGEGGGASKLTKDVINVISQLPPAVEALTGIKLENIVKKFSSDIVSSEDVTEQKIDKK